MKRSSPVDNPTLVIAALLIFLVVILPRIIDDRKVDLSIAGTVYAVEDFQPEIISDDFKTWIERVKSFTAVSMDGDTVTKRNFDRVEWQLVSEQAKFVVRPRIDSTSGERPKLIATIDIPIDFYNNLIAHDGDSI